MTDLCIATKGGPVGQMAAASRSTVATPGGCDQRRHPSTVSIALSASMSHTELPAHRVPIRDSAMSEHPPGAVARPAAGQESTASYTIDVDLELVPVTPLTPIPAAIDMDVRLGEGAGEGELQLLPITLGKGAFGRVVVGLYGGQRVAVKLLNTGLALPLPDAAIWKSEAARTATAARTSPEAAGPAGQHAGHGDGNGVSGAEAATVAAGGEQENDNTAQAAGRAFGGEVLHIVMQIGRALSYMHPTILHRDLKPANVLVSNADSEAPVIKLGDFGLARLRDTILVTREPEVGTVPYISPEAFEPANFIISDRADMYALGVILWELLSGMRPWGSLSDMQIACAVTIKGDRLSLGAIPPERCLPKLATLMKECWDADPWRRPAAAEFVKTIALVQQVKARNADASEQAQAVVAA
ncbi:hypothetical protein GPECTOR_12g487 [Gonium pectorale]|uniref:Protein kinase domain-containing protein n=1 Tax=Gonium pectorale TaxID=33097 RepID=A0A150GNZ4_GONPE|nr:hypothetical protein GPECTOR_12g487 [Gonium pectorale]|eukprot:KXZ51524.1 hypothetical protein GPECTOR_12g487 [Gonium pectorale]